jgi:hypothetical protein
VQDVTRILALDDDCREVELRLYTAPIRSSFAN